MKRLLLSAAAMCAFLSGYFACTMLAELLAGQPWRMYGVLSVSALACAEVLRGAARGWR